MILSGVDNRPPMLDKDLYDSWKSRMELYMQNREHERMILESVENGPLIWPTIEENGVIRTKKYAELSTAQKIQADCDMKATNIILQGLPTDIYSLVNHHRVAKDLWERVQLPMQGDDLIGCINKAMAFLIAIASSWFPSTNNQLRTSSNLRNQATIQDGRVTVQQVQGRQGQSYSSTGYKGEGHMARQCTQPKRLRNATWYKENAMLVEAQEAGQILDEEQLAFLADPGTEDLDTYDSDYVDFSNAKAVLKANISNYGSDVISEANKEQNSESVIAELERYKERVKTFEQRLNIDLNSHEKMIDSQMDDMIKEKLALKEQVDSLEQNLSKQINEKECLLQTFTVFKSESKEKEDKYMENEIDLEKKIN
ncbi:hypothetical protein Tco_0686084 [Tanacetum coccineum]